MLWKTTNTSLTELLGGILFNSTMLYINLWSEVLASIHACTDSPRQSGSLHIGPCWAGGELLVLFKDQPFCKACASMKSYKQHKKGPLKNKIIKFLRRVHTDIYNKGKTISAGGSKYCLILINNVFR